MASVLDIYNSLFGRASDQQASSLAFQNPLTILKEIGDYLSSVGNGGSFSLSELLRIICGGGSGGSGNTDTTFDATKGADNFTGHGGNDTFNAVLVNDAETLNSGDRLDGGAGKDVLNWTTKGSGSLAGVTIANIETINVTATTTGAVNLDIGKVTGVETLNLTANSSTGVTVSTKGNASTVSVDGAAGQTVAISDAASGSAEKLAGVSASHLQNGALNVSSDVLTTVSLTDSSNTDIKVTNKTAGHALTVNLTNASDIGITDATAGLLKINATGANVTTLDRIEGNNLTKIILAGDGALALGADISAAKLTAVDASAETGGVKVDSGFVFGRIAFTGGAGNDEVTVSAGTKAVSMGAGDDIVHLVAGNSAATAIGAITLGDGNDKVTLTDSNAVITDTISDFHANTALASTQHGADTAHINGDTIDISAMLASAQNTLGFSFATVANAADAAAALSAQANSNTALATLVFNSVSSDLSIDINHDGTAEQVLHLTGVHDLTAAAIIGIFDNGGGVVDGGV